MQSLMHLLGIMFLYQIDIESHVRTCKAKEQSSLKKGKRLPSVRVGKRKVKKKFSTKTSKPVIFKINVSYITYFFCHLLVTKLNSYVTFEFVENCLLAVLRLVLYLFPLRPQTPQSSTFYLISN